MDRIMQQTLNSRQVTAGHATFGIRAQCAAQVIVVIHQQVNTHLLTQFPAEGMHTQGLNGFPLKSGNGARLVSHLVVN
jgi:hypothetical protein